MTILQQTENQLNKVEYIIKNNKHYSSVTDKETIIKLKQILDTTLEFLDTFHEEGVIGSLDYTSLNGRIYHLNMELKDLT